MSEQIILSNPQEQLEPAASLPPEALMQAGDLLSKATLFALERNYLDDAIFENQTMRLLDTELPSQPEMAILELEQIGKPVDDDTSGFFTAIQTTLASCHDPRYKLIFIVSSDGLRNHIFIGVAAREASTQPQIFIDQLGQFLCSNWPGTRVKIIKDYKRVVEHVHIPLGKYRFARAFTGIPSLKTKEAQGKNPQTIDQFMRGMRGKPYIYMVLADPIAEVEIREMLGACRSLSGQMHAFTKATINRSLNKGISGTTSTSSSKSTSKSDTSGTSTGDSVGKSKGALGAMLGKSSSGGKILKGAGIGGVSALLMAAGGPLLLGGMLGMFGQLLPSASDSTTSGTSFSESSSESDSLSSSQTDGTSSGETLSFGREYLSKHAEACEKLLENTVKRLEIARAQGCWNVGVYLLSNQDEVAAQAQAQLKALISGEASSFEPLRVHDLKPIWEGQAQAYLDVFTHPPLRLFAPTGSKQQIHHPIGEAFEGLTTPLNTEELSVLANLPLREMPGLPLQPTAYFSLNPPTAKDAIKSVCLGNLLEGGEMIRGLTYDVDINSFTRHVFITGITGSGKSNTCRRFLEEMMERNVNFMVIEPAKDEYVQLALSYNQSGRFAQKIAVYVPGRTEWGGQALDHLQLNPFDIIRIEGATTQTMPHLDRLKSIFNASFPMSEILPVILEEALVELYNSQGWLEEKLPAPDFGRPTLENLFNRIPGLMRAKGYEDRIKDNITAALRTRIGSLMRGWKGELFNHPTSTPWTELFDRPVVVNLQQMGDDADKCFTMALLLNFMYEYRQAQHESEGSPESRELRHLAIIEEAHRVLRAAPRGAEGSGNPQAKMGEMFADILAEIRAYGQGLAIIDQVPSKLIPDALKNTNLKIVHRLVSMDDRQAMAGALALTDDQAKVIGRLKVGQAIVCGIQDDMASWLQILPSPLPKLTQAKKEIK